MKLENLKIVIVGGSGYIGYSLARYLASYYNVMIIDMHPPASNLQEGMKFQVADIRRSDEVKKALNDVDLVIHSAIIQIPAINEQKRIGYEVNLLGTQNVCRAVEENPSIKGMILTGSWHVIGERELNGVIDEGFGFRPDKVENRARLYALSKIAQETIVRYYDEMSDKIYGVIRMGTVLGEGMSEKTAANIFIEKALRGESITPFKHSMYRPMLYIDVRDICKAFGIFSIKLLNDEIKKAGNSLDHVVNVYYPEPITIIELAEIVKEAVIKSTLSKITPKIEVVDTGQKSLFTKNDKKAIKVDISKAKRLLGLETLKSPREVIDELVDARVRKAAAH